MSSPEQRYNPIPAQLLQKINSVENRVKILETLEGGAGSGTPYHNRVLAAGTTLTIPDNYSLVVAEYFEIEAGATLELVGDAALEVL